MPWNFLFWNEYDIDIFLYRHRKPQQNPHHFYFHGIDLHLHLRCLINKSIIKVAIHNVPVVFSIKVCFIILNPTPKFLTGTHGNYKNEASSMLSQRTLNSPWLSHDLWRIWIGMNLKNVLTSLFLNLWIMNYFWPNLILWL